MIKYFTIALAVIVSLLTIKLYATEMINSELKVKISTLEITLEFQNERIKLMNLKVNEKAKTLIVEKEKIVNKYIPVGKEKLDSCEKKLDEIYRLQERFL